MKINLLNDEKSFIAQHIALYVNSMLDAAEKGAPLDKKELKQVLRTMDKFVPAAVYIPIKQKELMFVQMVLTAVEHQFENSLIPTLEKATAETKEADLTRAKETLIQISALVKKIGGYMESNNDSSKV